MKTRAYISGWVRAHIVTAGWVTQQVSTKAGPVSILPTANHHSSRVRWKQAGLSFFKGGAVLIQFGNITLAMYLAMDSLQPDQPFAWCGNGIDAVVSKTRTRSLWGCRCFIAGIIADGSSAHRSSGVTRPGRRIWLFRVSIVDGKMQKEI